MKIDEDKSGYISRVEFRSAMEELGIKMTEEEFDLVNATYPHQEASGMSDTSLKQVNHHTCGEKGQAYNGFRFSSVRYW